MLARTERVWSSRYAAVAMAVALGLWGTSASAAPAAPPTAAPPSGTPPAAAPAQPPAAAPAPAQPPASAPAPAQPPATAPAQPPPATPPPAATPPAATPPPAGTPPPADPPPPATDPAAPATEAAAEPTPPVEPTSDVVEDTPPPVAGPPTEATPEAPPEYAVAEDAWTAMLEKQVVVERADGSEATGKLVASTEHAVVLVGDDGAVTTVQKADAVALRQPVAAPEVVVPAPPEPPAEAPPAEETDHPKAPKLGLFTSQGIAYTHWRTGGFRDGAATYALDFGAGYNFRENMGIYGVLGGNVGARLEDGETRGNMGHFGALIRYRGKKRFVFLGGLALAWSNLVEPERSTRDVGVSVPLKFMGQFQLKKHMHLGVGVGYEVGVFAQGRVSNAFSFQVTLARW